MNEDRFTIPTERLPPGFARSIDRPPAEPAEPRPAATAVLMRDADAGPEALLLRRHRSSGFVPGAYVFPGGRVDEADADAAVLDRSDGLDPAPAASFWVAAAREVLEETGVLLARDAGGRPLPDAGADARIADWRRRLLDEGAPIAAALQALEARLDFTRMVHCAHWVTPVVEPRRYDTHFFLAALSPGLEVAIDSREMTDAVWLTPESALERFAAGALPMVFPTVHTLESLAGHDSVEAALAAFRGRAVRRILPRLVRRGEGVSLEIEGEGEG